MIEFVFSFKKGKLHYSMRVKVYIVYTIVNVSGASFH